MKKISLKLLAVVLSLTMIMSIAPISVFAEDDILDYLEYEINNGEVTITDCNTSISGDVTIPDTIEGYPVTSIGDYAIGYYLNAHLKNELIYGFTVYGYTGSAAETYANENGIAFVALTDEPVTDEPTTEEPTTEEPAQDTSTVLAPNADSNITVTDTVAAAAPEMSVEDIIKSVKNDNVQILDKDGKELTKDALVGTGSKINILDKAGNILSTYEVMVKADVDGNGKITTADARLTLRASVGLDTIEGVYATAANYDGKDNVSTADARMILRKAVGLE